MEPRLSISSLKFERKKPDQILDDIGNESCHLITAVLVCSLTWAGGAMQMMTSAFTSLHCDNCTMETLTQEFELHGDSAYLAEWGTSSFMLGNMLGGSTLTHLADRYGRRPLLMFCLLFQLFAALATSLSPSIYTFFVFRFFHGAFYTGSMFIAWVAAYEHSSTSFRQYTTLTFGLTWVVGYCAVAPVALISPSWRHLIAISATPVIAILVLSIWFVPETLHYLVGKQRMDEVEDWISKVDSKMLADVPLLMEKKDLLDKGEDNKKVEESTLRLCLKQKKFIGYWFINIFLWTCDNFIYFGLSLYSTQLVGNIYFNYLTMGLIEVPAYIITPIVLEKFGRKSVVSSTHFIAAMSFLANLMFEGELGKLGCWLIGKLAISVSFMSLFVYASEIFPTEIRNVSVGSCEVMSKVGAILAPYINLLSAISPSFPPVVLATIAGSAGLFTLLLPETKDRPLPTLHSDSLPSLDPQQE